MPKYKEIDMLGFGRRVRQSRENLNMSRELFASELGVTPNFISDVEAGTKGLSLNNLSKTSQILGVSTDFLIFGIENDDERNRLLESIIEPLKSLGTNQLKCAESITRSFAFAIKEDEEDNKEYDIEDKERNVG